MITKKLLWVGSAAAAVVLGIAVTLILVSGGTNRDSGSATDAQPSQSSQESTTTTTASEDSSLASQLVRSKSVGFSTGQTDAAQDPSLTLNKVWVQPGDPLQITVSGFAPRSHLTVSIHSDPIELADLVVSNDGSGSVNPTIPVGLAADPGIHTIVVDGIGTDGQLVEVTKPVRVGFDSTAPWIDSFGSPGALSLSTRSVNTSTGPQTVTMSVAVHDDLSGFVGSFQGGSSSASWSFGGVTASACIDVNQAMTGGGTCVISSGDDLNGIYSSQIVFPAYVPAGTYTFNFLSLTDQSGNRVYYYDPSHQTSGGSNWIDITTLGYAAGSLDIVNGP